MARTVSLSISLNPNLNRHHHHHFHTGKHHHHPFLTFPKHPPLNLSCSSSSAPSSPLETPRPPGRFLTNSELQNLDFLTKYSYHQQLESGLLWVRVMREEEMDMTVQLLSESFAESMMMANGYTKLLEFLIKNYLIERKEIMPHGAMLLGIYRENGEEDFELAGTVELSFDNKGSNSNPPTPTPPKDSPYICNMSVRKQLRRRGIGWHLLKAGEELITKMSSSREVYLHCRIVDEGPFNMYTKAGYSTVKTDSILTLLTLQRRRNLMRKDLPIPEKPSDLDIPPSEEFS